MAFLGIPTSRQELQSNGFIKGAASLGARTIAGAAGIIGQNGLRDKANNIAGAIDDPNRHYTGSYNPLDWQNGGVASFANVAPQAKTPNAPQVQDQTFDPTAIDGLYGGVYAGGGGAAAYDPDTDPAKVAEKRNMVRSLMSQFEAAYNEVLGKVDQLASQKRMDFEKNYGDQQAGLDKTFGTTTTGIDDQYSARNAYHSSYRENAQQQAKDAYDSATGQLGQAKTKDLASVGQFAEQQKAEFGASRPQYNVDDYGDVTDLLDIGQNVQQAIGKIQSTGAGLGTDSQYLQKLNGIAPTQETGSAALKAQLDKLAQTGSNPDAKRAIAAVTIQNAGGDQSAWMDYFEKQQQQTGSNAVTDPTMVALQ